MNPILVLDGERDVIAVLIIRSKVAGAWRADALPWVLEAFKPLARAKLLSVVLRSRKAVNLWNRTKAAQEIFDELSKR